ncbi:hypothetical protein VVZ16_06890, partial [Brucella melitensis]
SGSCFNRIAGTALTICFVALSNVKPFHTFAGNALCRFGPMHKQEFARHDLKGAQTKTPSPDGKSV